MRGRESGASLLTTVVLVAVVGTLASIFSTLLSHGISASQSSAARMELAQVTQTIQNSLSCSNTFRQDSMYPPGSKFCGGTTNKPNKHYMQLWQQNLDGTVTGLTGPVSGSGKTRGAILGNWTVRATCSKADQTLVIKVAKLKGGQFVTDPLTGRAWDWNNSLGLIFGNSSGINPICLGTDLNVRAFVEFSGITAYGTPTTNIAPGPTSINVSSIVETTNQSNPYDYTCQPDPNPNPPSPANPYTHLSYPVRGFYRIYWTQPMSVDVYPVLANATICSATVLPTGTHWNFPQNQDAFVEILATNHAYVDIKVTSANGAGSPCNGCASSSVKLTAYDFE